MAPSAELEGGNGSECDDQAEDLAPDTFAELLGPHCVIKRVDKDQNVIGGTGAEEMQRELLSRARTQKRLGTCAEYVKDFGRAEKLQWALDLKEQANAVYSASRFEEAARLYNDCLVALDFGGTEEENAEVAQRLQLPVCTNLAACMIEMGQYARCVEICSLALAVDPDCARALYRRGLAHYRLGDFGSARPDFERALENVSTRLKEGDAFEEDQTCSGSMLDVRRRAQVYLTHIRRFTVSEKASCERMFERPIYADRPDPPKEEKQNIWEPIDDSDDAIDAQLDRIAGRWRCCPCRRIVKEKIH